jgi:caffeoyl-CoA O-methyltransferase
MGEKIDITTPAIHQYLEQVRPPSDPVLQEMEKLAIARDFPYFGAQCGRILYALVKMTGAKRVFELGSGFGYTMYWMAKAMEDGGLVIGTENDPKNVARGNEFFERGGLSAKTDLRAGDAIEVLKTEPGPFDLMFCDIDKHQYPQVLELAKERLRPGGILATDNILWSGRVISPDLSDPDTKGIIDFTHLIFNDPDFFSIVLPIRDGVSISIKTGS